MTITVNDTKYESHSGSSERVIKEEGNVTVVESGDLDGDEGLHELGYKAELHRTRGFKELFAMSLTCEFTQASRQMQTDARVF